MAELRRVPTYARMAVGLRGFLRRPIGLAEAERRLAAALEQRSARLLALVRDRVYGRPESPYLPLLRHAGIDFGDIERLVERDGVDGALVRLEEAGVYVTLDEFKGRRAIRRGSLEFAAAREAFDAPAPAAGLGVRSAATRGAGTGTLIGLGLLTEEAAHRAVMLEALGLGRGAIAVWLPILPGSAGVKNVLRYAKLGRPPERWFSHAPVALTLTNHAAWMTQTVVRLGRLAGSRLPTPEYVPLSEAGRVAEWLVAHQRDGRRCLLITYASSAVRACGAAMETGIGLDGVIVLASGEPLTEHRVAAIRAAGARVAANYSMSEVGPLAHACGEPASPGDMHLLRDRVAVIQRPRDAGGRVVEGFLLTALSPHAPKVMLNVEIGDTGRLSERACGCPFGALGYRQHVEAVSSYEKLTGEGMTYDATEFVRVVEEVLPARFGGAVTDYQIVEEEGDDGLVRLRLLVSPRLGPIAEGEVLATVRAAMRRGHASHRLAELVWGQAGALRVCRDEPVSTPGGKLLPFHVMPSRRDPATASEGPGHGDESPYPPKPPARLLIPDP